MTKHDKAQTPLDGLALMRAPFSKNSISKLPKPTKRQMEIVRDDFSKGIRCKLCGQWHHPEVVHLDYVGHAALTDRLLECDPEWNWEPLAKDEHGRPLFDQFGGMWINLTVCGVTRMGYGHPDGKNGGNALKEVIGDALRNAAMRFGAALDLWHKGELHPEEQKSEAKAEADGEMEPPAKDAPEHPPQVSPAQRAADQMITALRKTGLSVKENAKFKADLDRMTGEDPEIAEQVKAEIKRLEALEPASAEILPDEIPY